MPYAEKLKLTRGEIAELVAVRRLWYDYLTADDKTSEGLDIALDTMQSAYDRIFGDRSTDRNAFHGFVDPLCERTDMDAGTIARLCLLIVDPIEEA